jgi:hypothetical protein
MRLDEMYRHILQEADGADVVPTERRGRRRRELTLSCERLRALQDGERLEETLERTLMSLIAGEALPWEWFNQLNIAAGVGGGTRLNRAAVDLARFSMRGGVSWAGFKELKSWTSNVPLRDAIEQLFRYCGWFLALQRRGIRPYDREGWRFGGIQLHLLAPEIYFRNYGGIPIVRDALRRAEGELAVLRDTHPELRGVSLAQTPIVLPGRLGADEFIRCFDPDAVRRLLAAGRGAASALDVLRPDAVPELRRWLEDALVEAGVA